jgi:hypothetical protein
VEHNTWEYWDNVGNAADAVNDFHTRNPGAPRRIRALAFGSIPFRPIPPLLFASGRCNSERGVIVRGTPKSSAAPQSPTASAAPPSLRSALPSLHSALPSLRSAPPSRRSALPCASNRTGLYTPPHRRSIGP